MKILYHIAFLPASIRRRQNINNILSCKEGAFIKIHICRRGESLAYIADKYSVSPQELISFNALPAPIRPIPGLALAVPDSIGGKAAVLCAEIGSSAGAGTLSRIAQKLSFCICGSISLKSDISAQPLNPAPAALCAEGSALPLLALSNIISGSFSGAAAHEALKSPENRRALASAAVSAALRAGFMGLYVEFCSLYPFDRENFLHFMSFLSAAAHEKGLFLLSVAEPEPAAENSLFFHELQQLCEFTLLLCFDYPSCSPAPSMPLNLLRRDMEALRPHILPGKCLISFSDRALDFVLPRGAVKSMSSARALKLALTAAELIYYDQAVSCAAFNYRSSDGKSHRVFTPDVRTAEELCAIIDEYALAGVFFPRSECSAGPEFNYICSSFSAKKYI